MQYSKFFIFLIPLILFMGCVGNMNPTGGNSTPYYPYYVTQEPMVVKKITVPSGTILEYEEHWFKEGEQNTMMSENKLKTILLPTGKFLNWGGVPVTHIERFFNSDMRGFSVYADFSQLKAHDQTKFSQMWQSCNDEIGIAVKDLNDWSFNIQNISDVQSCSVLYQRYFKDNKEQQLFLDNLFSELKKVNSN